MELCMTKRVDFVEEIRLKCFIRIRFSNYAFMLDFVDN